MASTSSRNARMREACPAKGIGVLGGLLLLASGAAAQEPVLRLPPIDAGGDVDFAPLERLGGEFAPVDETGLAPVFVEIQAQRPRAFVGETVALEVRFGLDAAFLADEAIPLFRRRLDVPVQIDAPWLEDPESLELTRLFAPVPLQARALVARNEHVAEARRLPDRLVNGRAYRVFALDVRWIARASGTLVLEAPRLLFARGIGFRDDFLAGRTATGRHDAFVRGAELALEIVPVPERGRPPEWSRAVGNFALDARAIWDVEHVPARVRLEVALRGDGDLRDVELSEQASFAGFVVLGTLDDRGRARRTWTYDLELASAETRELAPLALTYFDPRPPGEWRTLATPPVWVPAEARFEQAAAARAESPRGAGETGEGGGQRLWLLAALLLALVLLGAWLRRRVGQRGSS